MEAAAEKTTTNAAADSRLDFGKLDFGCKHYRRRCKIRAPCCDEVFGCRHCHNESIADKHEICRHDVQKVICSVCDTEQPVGQVCTNCGVNMGEYYCEVCKFFDDDVSKEQYHCDECGICRVGGKDNFFHCKKCGSCYSTALRDKHPCVENSMRHHCPICYEYLFDSLKDTRVLRCGHTIHADCCEEMKSHAQYSCPICSKSVCDMSMYWRKLDEELGNVAPTSRFGFKTTTDNNIMNSFVELSFASYRTQFWWEKAWMMIMMMLNTKYGKHERYVPSI